MSTKAWKLLVISLAVIIVVLMWLLFTIPAHAPTTSPQATTTDQSVLPSPTASSSQPLDTEVLVTTPQPGSTVSHTFEIAGVAPGAWYDEAVFPIQVRDANGNLIGSSQGHAQGEWTTNALVTFTSSITVTASYEGAASLVLLKDNPSGLAQNADEVTIPIIIQ